MKLMNNVSKEEKKLIRKMFWRSGAMYASVNPVTMGGGGFCYSMIPFINHFYKDNEEKRREALTRHVKYFSTTIPMASFVMGIAGSMEDAQKIFGKDLVRVKTLDKMAESVGKALCHQISTF